MDLVIPFLSGTLLLAGAFFMLVAGIGVLRLPDVFTRMHAAGIEDTMGSALTLAGLMLLGGFSLVTAKLVIIWGLLWLTCSVATHAVARAALRGGLQPILAEGGSAGRGGPSAAAPGEVSGPTGVAGSGGVE